MTSTSTRLTRLKTFFWTVLVFNLAEYAAMGFFLARTVKPSAEVEDGSLGYGILMLFLLVLPVMLVYQAFFVLNKYFPAGELSRWLRGFVISLCVVQILASLFLSVVGVGGVVAEMPRGTRTAGANSFDLRAFLFAVSMLVAALWNLAAAVVLWRRVWVIRRNFRKGAWVSFEAA